MKLGHGKGVKPLLPQVSVPTFPQIDKACVATIGVRQRFAQPVEALWNQDKVHVIGIREYAQLGNK